MRQTLKYLNIKQGTGLFTWFFVLYGIAGFFTLNRFGVHYDELTQRAIGIENARYLSGRAGYEAVERHRFFGPLFETPAYVAEQVIYTRPLHDKLILRRALLFSLFLISVLVLYKAGLLLFRHPGSAVFAAVIYACWPRLWAEAHYNSKDVLFLALAVFTLYATLRYTKGFRAWLPFMLAGLATSVRVAGLFLLIMPLWREFSDGAGVRRYLRPLVGVLVAAIALYLVFPAIWPQPFTGFAAMLEYGRHNPWPSPTMLAGKEMLPGAVPGYYTFLWMLVTLPLPLLFLFLLSFAEWPALLRNPKWQPVILLLAAPSLYLLIFRPTLYNGWRHMYFLFLPLVLIGVRSTEYLFGKYRMYIRFMPFLSVIPVIHLLLNQKNPQVYFNSLKGLWKPGSFSLDYWGVSTLNALKSAGEKEQVKVYAFTETVYLNHHMLSKKEAGKVIPVTSADSADMVLVLNREGKIRRPESGARLVRMEKAGQDTLWVLYDRRSESR